MYVVPIRQEALQKDMLGAVGACQILQTREKRLLLIGLGVEALGFVAVILGHPLIASLFFVAMFWLNAHKRKADRAWWAKMSEAAKARGALDEIQIILATNKQPSPKFAVN